MWRFLLVFLAAVWLTGCVNVNRGHRRMGSIVSQASDVSPDGAAATPFRPSDRT